MDDFELADAEQEEGVAATQSALLGGDCAFPGLLDDTIDAYLRYPDPSETEGDYTFNHYPEPGTDPPLWCYRAWKVGISGAQHPRYVHVTGTTLPDNRDQCESMRVKADLYLVDYTVHPHRLTVVGSEDSPGHWSELLVGTNAAPCSVPTFRLGEVDQVSSPWQQYYVVAQAYMNAPNGARNVVVAGLKVTVNDTASPSPRPPGFPNLGF